MINESYLQAASRRGCSSRPGCTMYIRQSEEESCKSGIESLLPHGHVAIITRGGKRWESIV